MLARIDEDLALVDEMLALVPAGTENWRPPWEPAFSMAELAAHLAESFGGICACLARLNPAAFTQQETAGLTLSQCRLVLAAYRAQVQKANISDADWMRVIPTYFAPEGEALLAVLLVNLKHANHHAHQLFTYLKLLGVPVETRHLYRFTGA